MFIQHVRPPDVLTTELSGSADVVVIVLPQAPEDDPQKR